MHYYRALIMLNGPVLTQLLDLVVSSSQADDEAKSLLEQCVPTLQSDLVVLEHLHQIICVISRAEGFMNQNNISWLCNHASTNQYHPTTIDNNTDKKQVQY